MKHMLRKYFTLITDDEFLKIGALTEGFTNGDLATIALKCMDKKNSEKCESKYFTKCFFRSQPTKSVFTPCGQFEARKIRLTKGQVAAMGPKVEVSPVTFEDLKGIIATFKISVNKELVQQHVSYNKDHSYKPPDTGNVIRIVK